MNKTRTLTEGAIMLALFAILLFISIYVPIISLVSILFLPLPFIIYSRKYALKHSLLLFIAAVFTSSFVGTILSVPFAFLFGLTGIVIGYFLKKSKGVLPVFIAGSFTFLINLLLIYIGIITLLDIDLSAAFQEYKDQAIKQAKAMFHAVGQTPDARLFEELDATISLLKTLTPSILVFSSFFTVLVILLVQYPILKRLKLEIPEWAPFRQLQLPKSLLWYYLFTLIFMLVLDMEEGTYLYNALLNLYFLLQILLIVQGLSFIYFYGYVKKWPKAIPIIITILSPILSLLLRILGIIDLGFNLRGHLERKS